jgi:hypothetical protein
VLVLALSAGSPSRTSSFQSYWPTADAVGDASADRGAASAAGICQAEGTWLWPRSGNIEPRTRKALTAHAPIAATQVAVPTERRNHRRVRYTAPAVGSPVSTERSDTERCGSTGPNTTGRSVRGPVTRGVREERGAAVIVDQRAGSGRPSTSRPWC